MHPSTTATFHDFLPDYIERNPKFMDDELEFWVKEGKVSARGEPLPVAPRSETGDK